jgi:hypothetical protein
LDLAASFGFGWLSARATSWQVPATTSKKRASATERSVNQVQGRGHFPTIQSDAIEV